jgi:hypothetical protein
VWDFEDGTEFLVLNILNESGVFLEKLGLLLSSEVLEFRKLINSKRKKNELKKGLNECIVSTQNGRKLCVLLNVLDNSEIEELAELDLFRALIEDVFKFMNNKKIFANIFMHLPKDIEIASLKSLLSRYMDVAKYNNDLNYEEFPSKISLIIDDKQKELIFPIMEIFQRNKNLDEKLQEFKMAGAWRYSHNQRKALPFNRKYNIIIERAFLMKKKHAYLVTERDAVKMNASRRYSIKKGIND